MGIKSILLGATALVLSTSVNAALIDNGDTTTDTDTGLIWLDLTETTGLSVHDFFADTGGYLSSGWSLALGSQVDTLFVNAGVPDPSVPDPSDAAVIDLLLSLLGQTGEEDGAFGQGYADNGSGTFSLPLYWAWNNRPAINGSENCCYPPERAEVWLGLYLVMPTVIPPTLIPPTFGPEQVITTSADAARRVFAADIDGDGDQDVLSASSNDDKIAWYENTDGFGTFGPEQVITTSADVAFGVFAADLDGDGDQDVLSASVDDDKIAWYENTDGVGTFGPQQVISTAADGPPWVFAADLDGDGDQDVLSASVNDDKIAWYENTDGVGTFGPQQVVTTAADVAYAVVAADLDGDSDLDLLSASELDDKIAWYENIDGRGTFGPQQIITTAANGARAVFAADLDGDGDQDVLSASLLDDKIAWYENTDGLGTFGPQQVITTAADEGESVYAADLDGDGDLDVLSASSFDSKIAWYENTDGLGTFGPQQIITKTAIQAFWVVAADLDGDGDQDVLSASFIDDEIAWYENTPVSVGGAVTGLDLNRGQCGNLTTGEKVNIELLGARAWDCEAAGLVVDPGDVVLMIEIGVAGALPETVGGSTTGLSPRFGACRNRSIGGAVQFLIPAGESTWDCKAEGLVVNVGDVVIMKEVGIVE